jgi:cyclopropane-fatty-acyl-phospholipid synthase
VRTPRGAAYLATAPGSLGIARAYVAGDLDIAGVHPGDPYPLLRLFVDDVRWRTPDARTAGRIARSLGPSRLVPPPPPPQEALPDWRRTLEGLRHSRRRDAAAVHHHYDVSNTFYEYVLGPSMTYTCACYGSEQDTLEEAQEAKYDLVLRKLGLRAGQRLLDVGCGWGGMVRHAARRGVRALGVTLSREQARWAQEAIRREGLQDVAEVRHADYRDVTEDGFDAVSSIGLTEHIGVANYPTYFRFLRDRLRPGGRLLNHCITRPDNVHTPRVRGGFIDRYVFPDGELTGSGRIIAAMQDVGGLEVRHAENLREHYALTCAAWCANLVRHWAACVAEVGEATAKVWGLYLAGSRIGFERNQVQLHQVLAVRLHPEGHAGFPLRPDWGSL